MRKIWNILLLLLVVAAGCKDDWDNYYGEGEDERIAGANQTIWEALQDKPEYSKFVRLLKETGIDQMVNSKQVLTLWLPADESIPEEIMTQDSVDKRRFVLNHLNSLALYKTKLSSKEEIATLAKKYVKVAGSGNNFTVEKVKVTECDKFLCNNGVVHVIGGMLKPLKNIMEYILESGEEYSIYRDSLLAYNDTVFRPDLSYAIGVNEVGQTIYDSVFDIHNLLLKSVDFQDEKEEATLLLPSNAVIQDMMEDMKIYFDALGVEMTRKDTLACFDFIMKASYSGSAWTTLPSRSFYSGGGKLLKLDKQLISTNYEQCSNGVVYKFEKAYVPRGQFMNTVDFYTLNMFDLPEEEWSKYYQLSYGGTLNNKETHDGANSTDNIFSDNNNAGWKFLSVKAEKGEWVELVLLKKNVLGEIETAKLMPGKYKLTGKGYSWNAANVKIYLNGQSLIYNDPDPQLDGTAKSYCHTAIFPMGSRGHAFQYEHDNYKMMCDTIEVGVSPGNDIIRLESNGDGSQGSIIRIRALKFEPVGDNY